MSSGSGKSYHPCPDTLPALLRTPDTERFVRPSLAQNPNWIRIPETGRLKMNEPADTSKPITPIPPDDLKRNLAIARPNTDQSLPHIGLVGDTYTILLSGQDTGGRYCLVDMHIPPGGGPPPHRHDFEESFTILEGEIVATFRGEKSVVRAGETINIPANAPHSFTNASGQTVRLLCICAPAGQEEFFAQVGVPVATRTTPAPKLDQADQALSMKKAKELAPEYRTEF
jgi:quercetin dioxygenase-like cupin family protein